MNYSLCYVIIVIIFSNLAILNGQKLATVVSTANALFIGVVTLLVRAHNKNKLNWVSNCTASGLKAET